ncbi:MAG: hypothetical protein EOP81_07635 [Variovorax sp.]|nr:MAG: hypothetical protein EOP81_07635 [Variovorax sp.]
MAVICSFCGTENRAVARFCIECIGPLSPDFEPTQVLSRSGSADGNASTGLPTAFADFAAASGPTEPLAPAIARRATNAEPRKGLWLSVAAFAITLAIAAGGWMIAGAGGWYIYSAGKVLPETEPKPLVVAALPAAEPAAQLIPVENAAAPASQQVDVEPRTVGALESPAASSSVPLAASLVPVPPPASTPTPSPRPATPATSALPVPPAAQLLAQAPATAPPASPPTRAVPPPRPRPAAAAPRDTVRPGNPLAQCAELGFLARSRCMVAQCARAEHRATPACEPVWAQQRLMEEKRNPIMAN